MIILFFMDIYKNEKPIPYFQFFRTSKLDLRIVSWIVIINCGEVASSITRRAVIDILGGWGYHSGWNEFTPQRWSFNLLELQITEIPHLGYLHTMGWSIISQSPCRRVFQAFQEPGRNSRKTVKNVPKVGILRKSSITEARTVYKRAVFHSSGLIQSNI